MEKIATEDVVWGVCERLKTEGRNITGRAVLNELGGGSLSTVLQYLKAWKNRDVKATPIAAEIPLELQDSIRRVLGLAQQEATESLMEQMGDATSREAEALEALGQSEIKIDSLERELATTKTNILTLMQSAEKESAVTAEIIVGMRDRVGKLEQENDLLIRAGEIARTETAKAIMQVERADMAATKADKRAVELEAQVADLLAIKSEAEKGRAVAERHAQDLIDQVGKLEVSLEKTSEKVTAIETERSALTRDLNTSDSARRKAEGAGEQMEIRISEATATIERMRKELELARTNTSSPV